MLTPEIETLSAEVNSTIKFLLEDLHSRMSSLQVAAPDFNYYFVDLSDTLANIAARSTRLAELCEYSAVPQVVMSHQAVVVVEIHPKCTLTNLRHNIEDRKGTLVVTPPHSDSEGIAVSVFKEVDKAFEACRALSLQHGCHTAMEWGYIGYVTQFPTTPLSPLVYHVLRMLELHREQNVVLLGPNAALHIPDATLVHDPSPLLHHSVARLHAWREPFRIPKRAPRYKTYSRDTAPVQLTLSEMMEAVTESPQTSQTVVILREYMNLLKQSFPKVTVSTPPVIPPLALLPSTSPPTKTLMFPHLQHPPHTSREFSDYFATDRAQRMRQRRGDFAMGVETKGVSVPVIQAKGPVPPEAPVQLMRTMYSERNYFSKKTAREMILMASKNPYAPKSSQEPHPGGAPPSIGREPQRVEENGEVEVLNSL